MFPGSQIFETNTRTALALLSRTTVSAIGISPLDDNVRIVGISSGHVFAATGGAPLLTESHAAQGDKKC